VRAPVPGGAYTTASGTSLAAPHVAGQVALILSADPRLMTDPDEVKRLVQDTAKARTSTQNCGGVSGSARPNNAWGYGMIDAYQAVKELF
ncbi:MAG TPA: S8 family serine peptidase, partial [Polyangiales bacterium]|nr:S8 family serine peptidase [Polyangiales bacterium]